MSDEQDFFFDEETEKPTKAPKATKAPARKPNPAPEVEDDYEDEGIFSQQVTMTVAALMTVVALLVGVIVGYLIPKAQPQDATATTGLTQPTTGGSSAGPLPSGTDTSKLPAGHPDISGAAGGSSTTSQTK